MTLLALLFALAGCGDDDDAGDGGPARDATDDAQTTPLIEPVAPAAPLFTPCPAGFRESDACGVTVCDPFPESGQAMCAESEAHLVGTPGCAPLGAACADDFPTPREGRGALVYVREGASGDGSREAPFGDLASALSAAPAYARVLVAPGTYVGGLTARDVSIAGACPAATLIVLDEGDPRTNLVAEGHVAIGGVTLVGGQGVLAAGAAVLDVEGVVIARAQAAGIRVEGATLRARDLLVHSAVAPPGDHGGYGVDATRGAHVEIDGASIDRTLDAAFRADGEGTTLTLVRVVASGTTGFRRGHGLEVSGGAQATVLLSAFESNERYGAHVSGERSLLEISDSMIRDTRSSEPFGTLGHGIDHAADSRLVTHRVALVGNRGTGISVSGDDAFLEDTVVCDMKPSRALGFWAAGIIDAADLSLTLRRVVIARAQVLGIGVFNRAQLDGEDLAVVDTNIDDFPAARSHALTAGFHSVVRLARVEIDRAHDISLSVYESELDAEDLVIRDTRPLVCEPPCQGLVGGFGVGSYNGSRIGLRRFTVDGSPTCGVHIAGGGTAELSEGTVTHGAIGVCLQNDAQDLQALMDHVSYIANDTTLDVTNLPVPSSFTGDP